MFLETMLFGKPERIPLMPGGGRKSTKARWHKEGLPENLQDTQEITEYAYKLTGGKLELPKIGEGFWINERMIPQFEEKVIERKERSQIVQDWKGNICEISNEYTLEYLRNAIDFVTRRWIKCPVESRADWAQMKKRYDPYEPTRLPEDAKERAERLKNRTWPITFHFSGPFWQLREWLGFENLCMMFVEDPAFVEEMIEFWTEYIITLLKRGFEYIIPDEVHISEDMAYKKFSMISPEMTRKFLLPCWRKWADVIRSAGVQIYACDSDGFIGELIPIWIEAGINACDPIEVAAGNDIVEFRKQFGKNMAYRGGFDKRCIAAGKKQIDNELKRISPVIDDGGFIPGCDHGVPHDISWENFVYYVGRLAEAIGWL